VERFHPRKEEHMNDITDTNISAVADELTTVLDIYGDDPARLYTDDMAIKIAGLVRTYFVENISPIPSPVEISNFVWHRDGLPLLLENSGAIIAGELIPSVDLTIIEQYALAIFGHTGREVEDWYEVEGWHDEDDDADDWRDDLW
jgi:hypothetical protein